MAKSALRNLDIIALVVTSLATTVQIVGCWLSHESHDGEGLVKGINKTSGYDVFGLCNKTRINIGGKRGWLFISQKSELFGVILCVVALVQHVIFLRTRNFRTRARSMYVLGVSGLFILTGAFVFMSKHIDLNTDKNTNRSAQVVGPAGIVLCILSAISAMVSSIVSGIIQIGGCIFPKWGHLESHEGQKLVDETTSTLGCAQNGFYLCENTELVFMSRIFELFGVILCLVVVVMRIIHSSTKTFNIRAVSIYVFGVGGLFILTGAGIFVSITSDSDTAMTTDKGSVMKGPGILVCILSALSTIVTAIVTGVLQILSCALATWWANESCGHKLAVRTNLMFLSSIVELLGITLLLVAVVVHNICGQTKYFNIRAVLFYLLSAVGMITLSGIFVFASMYNYLNLDVNTEILPQKVGSGFGMCILAGLLAITASIVTGFATSRKEDVTFKKHITI